MSDERISAEPHDRLTRLGDKMIVALEKEEEYGDDIKAIVLISDGVKGGIAMIGYEENTLAGAADLFIHLRAIFKANGKDLQMLTLPQRGQG